MKLNNLFLLSALLLPSFPAISLAEEPLSDGMKLNLKNEITLPPNTSSSETRDIIGSMKKQTADIGDYRCEITVKNVPPRSQPTLAAGETIYKLVDQTTNTFVLLDLNSKLERATITCYGWQHYNSYGGPGYYQVYPTPEILREVLGLVEVPKPIQSYKIKYEVQQPAAAKDSSIAI